MGRLELWNFHRDRGLRRHGCGVLPEWADPVLPTLVGTALFIITVTLKMQPNAETMAVYERLKRCVETGGASSPSGVPEMQRRTP
jgi:hypothetical protein